MSETPSTLWQKGVAASAAGRHSEALSLLAKAALARSEDPQIACDLVAALGRAGRHNEARDVAVDLTRKFPNESRVWHNFGVSLELSNDIEASISAYRRAIVLNPNGAQVYICLGHALRRQARYKEAIWNYRRAIDLDGASGGALHGLAEAFGKQNRLRDLLSAYRKLKNSQSATAAAHSNLIYNMYYDSVTTPQSLVVESRNWEAHYGSQKFNFDFTSIDRSADRRLRIGYVSADLRDHPVGRLIEPVIARHDRKNFESVCYNDIRQKPDLMTARLREIADQWHDVSQMADDQLLAKIRSDRVDILVDPTGHFAENRLAMFSRRAAPIQVNAFGWCGTTGLSQMDYRVTDGLSDPTGKTDAFHTEKLIRMPRVTWVYQPWETAPDVGTLPADRNGFVTFANLNNGIKTTPAMAALWCEIVRRVPGSKLMILCRPEAHDHLTSMFINCGLAMSRLILVPNQPRHKYLETWSEADIAFDPFPFNGDNSSCDALWMGVPLISLYGATFASRRGLSHLSAIGLSELAAASPSQYAESAVSLATDRERLRSLRQGLRQRMRNSPLGDVKSFVASFELALRQSWQRWIQNS